MKVAQKIIGKYQSCPVVVLRVRKYISSQRASQNTATTYTPKVLGFVATCPKYGKPSINISVAELRIASCLMAITFHAKAVAEIAVKSAHG